MRGTELSLERKKRFRYCCIEEIYFSKMKLLITVSILSSSLIFISVVPVWSSDAKGGKYIVGTALLQTNRNTRQNSFHSQINTVCAVLCKLPLSFWLWILSIRLTRVDWSAGSWGIRHVERMYHFLFFCFVLFFLFVGLFLYCDWFH